MSNSSFELTINYFTIQNIAVSRNQCISTVYYYMHMNESKKDTKFFPPPNHNHVIGDDFIIYTFLKIKDLSAISLFLKIYFSFYDV